MNCPVEIVSHILSFRPRHPIAKMIMDFKEQVVAEIMTECYENEDQSIFDDSLHKSVSYTEGDLFWKNTLGDSDQDLYCLRVRYDYDAIYNGDWNYQYAPMLGLYVDPTQPKPRFDYTQEAYADPVQRKKEWAIWRRRLTGDI